MFLIHHYVLAANTTPIKPNEIVSAMQSGCYETAVVAAKKCVIELATVPNKTRVLVDISGDFRRNGLVSARRPPRAAKAQPLRALPGQQQP